MNNNIKNKKKLLIRNGILTLIAIVSIGIIKVSADTKQKTKEVKVGYTRIIENKTYDEDSLYIMGYKEVDYSQIISYILTKAEASINGIEGINLNGISLKDHLLNASKVAYEENVNVDIMICQQLLETGYYAFAGSRVKPSDNNYAGLGAIDSGNTANGFPSNEIGQLAQAQHLKAYASEDAVTRELVDERFSIIESLNKRGTSPTVKGLSETWASNPVYGEHIATLYTELVNHKTNEDLVREYADVIFGENNTQK